MLRPDCGPWRSFWAETILHGMPPRDLVGNFRNWRLGRLYKIDHNPIFYRSVKRLGLPPKGVDPLIHSFGTRVRPASTTHAAQSNNDNLLSEHS